MSMKPQYRYPGIRSFESAEQELFFGRSEEIRSLYAQVSTLNLVVLFSKSGIGKSSLLNAGLVPLLELEPYIPIKIRLQDTAFSPVVTIKNALRPYMDEVALQRHTGTTFAEAGLWESLRACRFERYGEPAMPVFLLDQERTDIARVGRSKAALKYLKTIARRELDGGRPLIENQRFRDRIAQVEIELMALEITNLRALCTMARKRAPGPEPSLLKLKGSEIEQMLSELMMRALGHRSIPRVEGSIDANQPGEPIHSDFAAPLSGNYFNCRKTSIYGGSNEIQRNIISRMILGL